MINVLKNWFAKKKEDDSHSSLVKLARKKLFIHAGTYKTGTTYFQNTMYSNRAALAQSGLLYPKAGLGLTTTHNRHAHRILGIDIAAGRKNRFPGIINHLIDTPHLKSALVSYEGFGHLPSLRKLLQCKPCFDQVDLHGILVFRPHIDLAISLYRELCQNVSFQGDFKNMMSKPGAGANHRWQRTLEYRMIVELWQQLTGDANLHLLSYRRISHDTAQELLAVAGHEFKLVPPIDAERNPTLSAPIAELIRRMNKQKFNTQVRHQLARELTLLDAKFPEFSKYCEITHDQAIQLEKSFENDRQFLTAYGFDAVADLTIGDKWRWGSDTNMGEAVLAAHEALITQLREKDENDLAATVSTALEAPT